MIFDHGRRRREADRAAQNLRGSEEAFKERLAQQEARWRYRTPWLLPLALTAGFLVKRAKPGKTLWSLARGLVMVGEWLNARYPLPPSDEGG